MSAQHGEIDVRGLAPMFGMRGDGGQPDYLEYDIRGRGLLERMFFNCGVSYLGGMVVGGVWGAASAYRSQSGGTFRVTSNTLLNGFGKRGAGVGNALGAIALMYTCYESVAENLQIDAFAGYHQAVNPVSAGVLTGLTYKCLAGPRALVLAGIIGGAVSAGIHYGPTSLR
eukprot:CAMPEP_0118899482 /NCGR_PEP_ID=MMETSP1166-20130328/6021_1 /TAXON_ID=1104430 /ORGANISM="Chrysoreinhardia sp, Strain CCMP3193" /LENGTH=169 /DNA_ID=CAMNT_0006838611 /DNA_START=23 /DNA_END=532 /DNA_ORIENTATION=+